MATDIKTTLTYATDDKTRPYFYAYERTEDERKKTPHRESDFGGTSSAIEVVVKDARSEEICLDKNSFELVKQITSLNTNDFYNNPEKIIDVYYPEMAAKIKDVTGAAHVEVFHHQVRNEAKNNGNVQNLNTSIQGYAMGIHSDTHPQAAEELFKQYANSDKTKHLTKGRFLYINAWRNISDDPIGNNHLAVCDESSLVKPDDYITCDLFMQGNQVLQYRLSDRNSYQHRWYYYSRMKKDEVILFKQWDSDRNLLGRLCFHTAFLDPNAPKDTPARESIEVRAIAYFPDHKPNTCPPLPEDKEAEGDLNSNIEEDVENIKKGVDKILVTVDSLNAWPSYAKQWIKMEYSKGKTGVKAIAEALANDSTGQLGLKQLNKHTKSKIVAQLIRQNTFEQRLRMNVEKIKLNEKGNNATHSKLMYALAGVGVGWIFCMLLNGNIRQPEL